MVSLSSSSETPFDDLLTLFDSTFPKSVLNNQAGMYFNRFISPPWVFDRGQGSFRFLFVIAVNRFRPFPLIHKIQTPNCVAFLKSEKCRVPSLFSKFNSFSAEYTHHYTSVAGYRLRWPT